MFTLDLLQILFRMDQIRNSSSQQGKTPFPDKTPIHVNVEATSMMEMGKNLHSSQSVLAKDSVELTLHDSEQILQQQFLHNRNDMLPKVKLQLTGKKKDNGELDSDHCHIVFSLELESLKQTVMDVRVQSRILTIILYNDTADIEKLQVLVEAIKPSLRSNLGKEGYTLSTIKVVHPTTNDTACQFLHTKINGGVDMKI